MAKTFAAVIVLQLMEEGKLSLDDPLSDFGIRLGGRGVVGVRHVLSHTSESQPGTFFRYSGRRWEHLGRVIKAACGHSVSAILDRCRRASLTIGYGGGI